MFATIKSGVATLFAAATPSPSRNETALAKGAAVPLTPESAKAEIAASVPPRSAGVPPKPAAAVDFISQAEVTRRVEIALERAALHFSAGSPCSCKQKRGSRQRQRPSLS